MANAPPPSRPFPPPPQAAENAENLISVMKSALIHHAASRDRIVVVVGHNEGWEQAAVRPCCGGAEPCFCTPLFPSHVL